jgi:flagellar basal body-associated protein FliL
MDDSAQEKKHGKGKTVTIVLLLLLLLGSVGSSIFLWNKEQHSTGIALSKI